MWVLRHSFHWFPLTRWIESKDEPIRWQEMRTRSELRQVGNATEDPLRLEAWSTEVSVRQDSLRRQITYHFAPLICGSSR